MSIDTLVKTGVDKIIKDLFIAKPDIVNLCLDHGNKQKLIGNLINQLKMAEIEKGVTLTKEKILEVVFSFTKMYCGAVLSAKEKEIKAKQESEIQDMLMKGEIPRTDIRPVRMPDGRIKNSS